jgi:hypothetical protein
VIGLLLKPVSASEASRPVRASPCFKFVLKSRRWIRPGENCFPEGAPPAARYSLLMGEASCVAAITIRQAASEDVDSIARTFQESALNITPVLIRNAIGSPRLRRYRHAIETGGSMCRTLVERASLLSPS